MMAAKSSGRLSLSSRHWSSALSNVGPNHPSFRNLDAIAKHANHEGGGKFVILFDKWQGVKNRNTSGCVLH